jgi:hypothetical protein
VILEKLKLPVNVQEVKYIYKINIGIKYFLCYEIAKNMAGKQFFFYDLVLPMCRNNIELIETR